MKLKAIAAAVLFLAGLSASFALADAGHGRGKGKHEAELARTATTGTTGTTTEDRRHGEKEGRHATTGKDCRPAVSLILKGTLLQTGASSLDMHVLHANRHARPLVGSDVTVLVDARTKVRRHGKATLADLVVGDRILVQARACKADLLSATRSSTTSTSTSTTSTSTAPTTTGSTTTTSTSTSTGSTTTTPTTATSQLTAIRIVAAPARKGSSSGDEDGSEHTTTGTTTGTTTTSTVTTTGASSG